MIGRVLIDHFKDRSGLESPTVPLILRPTVWMLLAVLLLVACDNGERQRLQLAELERQNRADSLMLNDSLARDLADWFDRHGTRNEQMRAHYILGRTYADRGESPAALDAYNDAVDRADTTAQDCDYKTLSRVHAQKAELFYYQLLADKMIREERQAMRYALLARDTMQYLYCYGLMAEGYDMKDMADSALYFLNEVYKLYKEKERFELAASLCCSMADIYIKKDSICQAKEKLFEYERQSGFFDETGNIEEGRELYYYIKGLYYISVSAIDSADYFFRKTYFCSSSTYSQLSAYKGLLKVFERRKDIDSLTKYSQAFEDAANYSHNEMEMQSMLQLQSMYDYSHKEKVAMQNSHEAQMWKLHFWIVALSSCLFFLIIFFAYRNLIRKYRLEKHLKDSSVVVRLKEMANSNPPRIPSNKDWKDLRLLINREIPSFYNTLNTERYTLTDMEYDVCLLRRVYLSPTEIYKLKGCSPSYVSNMRTRLLLRIFGEKGCGDDFDRKIMEII